MVALTKGGNVNRLCSPRSYATIIDCQKRPGIMKKIIEATCPKSKNFLTIFSKTKIKVMQMGFNLFLLVTKDEEADSN